MAIVSRSWAYPGTIKVIQKGKGSSDNSAFLGGIEYRMHRIIEGDRRNATIESCDRIKARWAKIDEMMKTSPGRQRSWRR